MTISATTGNADTTDKKSFDSFMDYLGNADDEESGIKAAAAAPLEDPNESAISAKSKSVGPYDEASASSGKHHDDTFEMEGSSTGSANADDERKPEAVFVDIGIAEAQDVNNIHATTTSNNNILTTSSNTSQQQRAGRCGQWTKYRFNHFASVLLFVIGSILYLIMAVKDYHWAQRLHDIPMYLRNINDDIAWTNWKIEEVYKASGTVLPCVEEAGAVLPCAEEEAVPITDISRSGGVRRMIRRELIRENDRRLEVEKKQAKIQKKLLARRRLSKAAKRENAARSEGEEAAITSYPVEQAQSRSSSSKHRNLQDGQTPEELYYDECWGDLPQEIQDAFTVLGYSETLWDEGGEVASDDFDWSELSAVQLEAATVIGYTEDIWCNETEPSVPSPPTPPPVTVSPTKQPTLKPVTASPTNQPTRKPVTDSPTKQPTLNPVTDSPTTKQPTLKPVVVTERPTTKQITTLAPVEVSQETTVLWGDLPAGSQSIYATLGYDETLWNSGESVAVDTMTWDDMNIGQRFAAYAIGFTGDSWDSTAPGEHFANQPRVSTEDTSDTNVDQPLPTPSPVRITAAPVQTPSKSPTKSPTQSPSPVPSRSPSQGPSRSPSKSPTPAPTTALPIPVPSQNIASPTPPVTPEVSAPVEPAAPTPSTPAELYEDEWWRDLPPQIQTAYAVLLYNETAWDTGVETATNEMFWDELTPEMQEAALFIGYTQEMWDADFEPSMSPTVKPALAPAPTNSTFAGFFFDPNTTATNTTEEVAQVVETPQVEAGTYDEYDWAELPPDVQVAANTLGYDQEVWCMGGVSASDDLFWDELSPEQQEAAGVLGYSKETWDVEEDLALISLLEAATEGTVWEGLSVEEQEAASIIGYSKESWDTEGLKKVAAVGLDDDYLFEVAGLDDVWVSNYQILYFFAALSFVFVGFLDLVREKHIFHIAMILAGFFGVLSAVYVEENFRLSDIFNAVSVHLYLLESITLFGTHRRSPISVEAPNWVKFLTMSGDFGFILGAFIDVVLTYFYLFDDTVNWDVGIMIASIFAAVAWLHCSLVYVGAFFYYPEEKYVG